MSWVWFTLLHELCHETVTWQWCIRSQTSIFWHVSVCRFRIYSVYFDRPVWANSAESDQKASETTTFAIHLGVVRRINREWNGKRLTLRKHAYSNILKILQPKYTENFTTKQRKVPDKKKSAILYISAQKTDCGYPLEPPRRGSSNEYPQSMFLSKNKTNFLSKNKKIMYSPVNPSFTI